MIRKLIKIIILMLLLLVLFSVTAYAETEEQLSELGETINDQLRENTDGEVSEIIDEYGQCRQQGNSLGDRIRFCTR